MGEAVWAGVNQPNLVDHIAPSRDRADLVVDKAADHARAPGRLMRPAAIERLTVE